MDPEIKETEQIEETTKPDKSVYNFIFFIGICVLVILAMFLISSVLKSSDSGILQEEILCIANNSELFLSKTCGHCFEQEEILGNNTEYFKIIDCTEDENMDYCVEKNIISVPTWIINNKSYTGVRGLKELKELTKC